LLLTNEQREQLTRQLGENGGWIIRKNLSNQDIVKCKGVATKDTETNTCARCVAANKTAYKPNNLWSPTHPNCKCEGINGSATVQVDFPASKLTDYLFVNPDKTQMMHKIGYRIEDSEELRQTLTAVIKKTYEEGRYKLRTLDEKGQHVQIDTILLGKRDHAGELHKCHAGCVLWPYGKIRVATPLIVDDI